MVRHIVTWNFKDGLSPEEKLSSAAEIKARLEDLSGIIPGIVELKVLTQPLSSSNRDLAVNSIFESAVALDAYQVHPAHQEVSDFVGIWVRDRACIDYEE